VVNTYTETWAEFVGERLPALLRRESPEPADDSDAAWDAVKTQLPGFVLAPVGGTRCDANTGAHTALVIDVDHVPSRKALFAACARYVCAVYESPSSRTRGKGLRLRVVAALAEPLAPALVKAARRAFARDLGLDPGAAGVSKADSVSQVMFVGRIGGTDERRMWVFSGAEGLWTPPADLEPEAVAAERSGGPTSSPWNGGAPLTPAFDPSDLPKIPKRLRTAIEPKAGRQRRGGRDLMRGVGGMYARKGYHPDAIYAAVLALPSSQPEKRATEAREAAEQWYSGDPRTAGVSEVARHFADVLGGDDGEELGRKVVRAIDKAARRPGEPEGWHGVFDSAAARDWLEFSGPYWARREAAALASGARTAKSAYVERVQAERRAEAEERLREVAPDLVGQLETDDNGQPYSHSANIELAVRHLVSHAVARNAASGRVLMLAPVVLSTPGGDVTLAEGLWGDVHTTRLHAAVCRLGLKRPGRNDVDAQVVAIATEREHWPIRRYLERLPAWDGRKRSLCAYFGVERTDYAEWVCGAWLRSCVARGVKPGCQVDHMLVLEGRQGTAKSTALRVLAGGEAGDWFGPFTASVKDDKKVGEQLQGKWIVEIGELDRYTRTFSEADLKECLSRREDDYRGAFERHALPRKRTAVMAGTTNRGEYLNDEENRRYWPIITTAFDLAGLTADREQLWAQALHEYRTHCESYVLGGAATGLEWWPATPELRALCTVEQDKRIVGDAWGRAVARWVRQQSKPFTTTNVAEAAVGLELERIDARTVARVERCLLACGCVRTETKRGRAWRRG